jgi:uncharacterized protein (TIGR02145 family)
MLIGFMTNTGATHLSGLIGLPDAIVSSTGGITFLFYGYFWSSTESGANTAWERSLFQMSYLVSRGNDNINLGYSVRCLKDN